MKILIFDSGTIINLAMNGMLYILEELKKKIDGKFIITQSVKYEIIERPMKVPRFEFEALSIKNLLERKIIELPSSIQISEEEIRKETQKLLSEANHLIHESNQTIQIVSEAEMSCLAVSSILEKRKIENLIAIDERTTRILSEDPRALESLISQKLHRNVKLEHGDFSTFAKFRFIRSSELVYVAYKPGIIQIKDPKTLEAALYATKFKGCAITWEEINELKKL